MPHPAPTRDPVSPAAGRPVLCAILLCGTALGSLTPACAQESVPPQPSSGIPAAAIPASQPTAIPPQDTTTPPSSDSTPAGPKRARITYADNQLTVSANNSSLNQILREIARQTGMKISGGVTDERVFGIYGPAPAARILATLLDGTGSNMLLVQSPGDQSNATPVELVLTPRHGGPTPQNPNAPSFNDTAEPQADSSPITQPPPRRGSPGPDLSQPPTSSIPTPGAPPSATDTPAGPATTQDQSPNGPKTPQQIYEQLLRLRQQAPQPQPQ